MQKQTTYDVSKMVKKVKNSSISELVSKKFKPESDSNQNLKWDRTKVLFFKKKRFWALHEEINDIKHEDFQQIGKIYLYFLLSFAEDAAKNCRTKTEFYSVMKQMVFV